MANANYLQEELKKASFDHKELTLALFGGPAGVANKRKWEALFDADPLFDYSNDKYLPREELMKLGVRRALATVKKMKANRDLLAAHSPVHGEGGTGIGAITGNASGITDHYALFVMTLYFSSTPEQQRAWLVKAMNLEIIGTYAQTELGHGTNVRGLETIAVFNDADDTFTLNMPTVGARKWWPGALGILATHAVIYARMFVKGKDLGYHAFMVQIRDENLMPLPGVEVGDIGPKMGAPTMDAGYLSLKDVRIPRFNMLAKFQQLDRDGTYHKPPSHLGKIAYATMMKTRVLLSVAAGHALCKGLTIALRYNAFRQQGFVDSKKGVAGGEHAIIDYPIQQHRLFPRLASGWALIFGAIGLNDMLRTFDDSVKAAGKDIAKVDTTMLPELHATSCGVKSYGTEMACEGLEEARKCCGGHGYALYSGISQLILDYLPSPTYEGDRIPMALQTARVLLGALMGKIEPRGTFAYLKRETDVELSDPSNLDNVVAYWETLARRVVVAAGEKVIESGANGMKPEAAWQANHVVLMAAAHAHTMYYLVQSFADPVRGRSKVTRHGYDATLSGNTRAALGRLCLLFALHKLQEVSPAFTRIGPEVGAKVDDAVKQLLSEIRPDALAFCEAWEFPDRTLKSAIARRDGKIYEAVAEEARRNPLNRPEYTAQIREILDPWLNKELLRKAKL